MSRRAPLIAALVVLAADLAAAAPPQSIIELQPFRRSETAPIAAPDVGTAELIELNPHINAWLILNLDRDGGTSYHLQNADPDRQRVRLAGDGLVITAAGQEIACPLWSMEDTPLEVAAASGLPYAPLCGGRLLLRNPVAGRRTDLERVTEFLRDQVSGGEAIVGFVRDHLFRDA